MITLEQVEKLRTMANVTYDEAKTALEAANGDLLEAIIILEKQGKVNPPNGGYYSSKKAKDADGISLSKDNWEKENSNYGKTFSSFMKGFGAFCASALRKCNAISFEVLKGNESKASIPVTAMVLLIIFAFWITVPLIIIGLFFGFRYRFHGPEFNGTTINDAMNSAADAAENLKHKINDF